MLILRNGVEPRSWWASVLAAISASLLIVPRAWAYEPAPVHRQSLELPMPGVFDKLLALEARGAPGRSRGEEEMMRAGRGDLSVALGFRMADAVAAIATQDLETMRLAWSDCRKLVEELANSSLKKTQPPSPDTPLSPQETFALWSQESDQWLGVMPARPLVLAAFWVQGARHVLRRVGERADLSGILREPLYLSELERAVRALPPSHLETSSAQACLKALKAALPLVSQPQGMGLPTENLELLRAALEECGQTVAES